MLATFEMCWRQNHTATFSSAYQVLNSLHVPVSVGVFLYEAIGLYEGLRVIASKGEESRNCSLQQLAQWCACGIVAGLLGIDADSLWDLYSWSSVSTLRRSLFASSRHSG